MESVDGETAPWHRSDMSKPSIRALYSKAIHLGHYEAADVLARQPAPSPRMLRLIAKELEEMSDAPSPFAAPRNATLAQILGS